MKFGIRIPMTVEEALQIDKENGNNLWEMGIKKEMKNSRVAFKILGQHEQPPPGYKKMTCHMT